MVYGSKFGVVFNPWSFSAFLDTGTERYVSRDGTRIVFILSLSYPTSNKNENSKDLVMYGNTNSKSMDHPSKVANPVSWTGKMNISLSTFAPENLVSRD